MQKYVNRDGVEYTFITLSDKEVLWEGDFKYCRVGYPNIYNEAYKQYKKDGGTLSVPDFIDKVHEYKDHKMGDIAKMYGKLVYSNKEVITMVDPPGGPYFKAGEKFAGGIIDHFVKHPKGYLIVIKTQLS